MKKIILFLSKNYNQLHNGRLISFNVEGQTINLIQTSMPNKVVVPVGVTKEVVEFTPEERGKVTFDATKALYQVSIDSDSYKGDLNTIVGFLQYANAKVVDNKVECDLTENEPFTVDADFQILKPFKPASVTEDFITTAKKGAFLTIGTKSKLSYSLVKFTTEEVEIFCFVPVENIEGFNAIKSING